MTFNRRLAERIIALRGKGNVDPSCDEILLEYLGVEDFPKIYLNDVRDRLKDIQRIVREESGLLTCLVSSHYYDMHREVAPITEAEARRCLPMGRGIKPYGIKFANGKDDLIYQISTGMHLNIATNSVASGVKKILKGNKQGYIPDNKAGRLIKSAHQIVMPAAALRLEEKAD